MKIRKSLLSFVGAIMVAMSFTACSDDWGKQDPPAGGQIYPSKQIVATYDFEYSEEKPEFSDFDITNKVCEVVMDDSLGSNVLRLDSAGAARIANPFNGVKLQSGAGIAFYVKVDTLDLERPLFSFGAEDESVGRFYFTANGQLSYSKPGQLQSLNLNENDPAVYKTGILDADKWHFVALQLTTTGYQLYVDGNKSLSGSAASDRETSFSYQTLVDFIQSAPYIYIGTNQIGDDHTGLCIDEMTLVRNQMEEKDWNKKPGSAGSEPSKVYVPVGTEDCSTPWWTEFSDYFQIPAGATFHTQFINHTSGGGNWNNWNLCVSTNAERGGTGYAEYFVIRSDLYGWGGSYDSGTWTNSGYPSDDAGWGQFRLDMEGALVDLTVARDGATVKVTAVATAKNGTVYTETFTTDCGDGNQTINAFLIVDGSYLQIDPDQTYVGTKYNSGSYLVGPADCTGGWWTYFSEPYDFESGPSEENPFVFHFINNNSGGGANWNNWLLVCTSGGGPGSPENFVLRSDAFGWGSLYDGGTMTQSFNWDTYVQDMHGAECWVGVSHSGPTVKMIAKQKMASGEWFPEYSFETSGASGTVGFFLTAELASLDILDVAYYPYFSLISTVE